MDTMETSTRRNAKKTKQVSRRGFRTKLDVTQKKKKENNMSLLLKLHTIVLCGM